MPVEFKDNSAAVLRQVEKNIGHALHGMGLKWEEIASMEITSIPRLPDATPGMAAVGVVDMGTMRVNLEAEIAKRTKELLEPLLCVLECGSIEEVAVRIKYAIKACDDMIGREVQS